MANFLVLVLIVLFIFHWLGGFEFIKLIKNRKLNKRIHQSFETNEILGKKSSLEKGRLETLTAFETMRIAESLTGTEEWLPALYRQHQNSVEVSYLYGAYLVKKGWLARGGGAASSVSSDGAETFYECLDEADKVLAPLLDKTSQLKPAVMSTLITVYKGISRSELAEALCQQRVPTDHTHFQFNIDKVTSKAERWGGNKEQMFDLAKTMAAKGGCHTALLAAAWIEHEMDQDQTVIKKTINSGDKDEILKGFHSLSKLPTVINTIEDQALLTAMNIYAVFFSFLGDKKNTRKALENTVGMYTTYPWKYTNHDIKIGYYKALLLYKAKIE